MAGTITPDDVVDITNMQPYRMGEADFYEVRLSDGAAGYVYGHILTPAS